MQAEITLDQETFKALAGEKRIQILKELSHQQKTQTELAQKLALSAPTVAEHLQLLKNAGLVEVQDDNHKWKYYALTRKGKKLLNPDETKIMVLLAVSGLAFFWTVAVLFGRYWNAFMQNTSQPLILVDSAPSKAINLQVLQEGITRAIQSTLSQVPPPAAPAMDELATGATSAVQVVIDQNIIDANTWISNETISQIAQKTSQEILPNLANAPIAPAPQITVPLIQLPELVFLVLITLLLGLLIGYYVQAKTKV